MFENAHEIIDLEAAFKSMRIVSAPSGIARAVAINRGNLRPYRIVRDVQDAIGRARGAKVRSRGEKLRMRGVNERVFTMMRNAPANAGRGNLRPYLFPRGLVPAANSGYLRPHQCSTFPLCNWCRRLDHQSCAGCGDCRRFPNEEV